MQDMSESGQKGRNARLNAILTLSVLSKIFEYRILSLLQVECKVSTELELSYTHTAVCANCYSLVTNDNINFSWGTISVEFICMAIHKLLFC